MENDKQQELAQTRQELAQASSQQQELSQKEQELSNEISQEQNHEQSEMKSDISEQFKTTQYEKDGQSYKEISGSLGVPGSVVEHRNQSEQSAISKGTGDDAGHLIANQFGAPGDEKNLNAQNWKANRYGTYKQMENDWSEKLSEGYKIDVTVTDITKNNEDRPYMRSVNWTETDPNGKEQDHSLAFANTTTPENRAKTMENEQDQQQENSMGM